MPLTVTDNNTATDECDMSTGQDRQHGNWKQDKVMNSVTFSLLFEHTFLPVTKWHESAKTDNSDNIAKAHEVRDFAL